MAWERVLFRQQGYPDNYVDPNHFFNELKTNLHTPTYSVKDLCLYSSCFMIRPFTLVCLFVCLFVYLSEGWLNSLTLLALNSVVFVISSKDAIGNVKPFLFLLLFVIGVSPILCTLTQSISDDTLWAMTAAMLFFHLMFYSYKATTLLYYNAVSLNAVIFSTVCLASMLDSAFSGLALVSVAINFFAFPKVNMCPMFINAVLVAFSTALLMVISLPLAITFVCVIITILFVFPLWLFYLQDLKNNIYGPWDEVIIA